MPIRFETTQWTNQTTGEQCRVEIIQDKASLKIYGKLISYDAQCGDYADISGLPLSYQLERMIDVLLTPWNGHEPRVDFRKDGKGREVISLFFSELELEQIFNPSDDAKFCSNMIYISLWEMLENQEIHMFHLNHIKEHLHDRLYVDITMMDENQIFDLAQSFPFRFGLNEDGTIETLVILVSTLMATHEIWIAHNLSEAISTLIRLMKI